MSRDLVCPRCGEPTDNDEFHEAAAEQDSTYSKVIADFYSRGCIALGWSSTPCERTNTLRSEVSSMLYDLLGDDTDGIINELEDAEMMGLFG